MTFKGFHVAHDNFRCNSLAVRFTPRAHVFRCLKIAAILKSPVLIGHFTQILPKDTRGLATASNPPGAHPTTNS